jgi:hypothetical protein
MIKKIIYLFIIALVVAGCSDRSSDRRRRVSNDNEPNSEMRSNRELEVARSKADYLETYTFDVGKKTYSIELGFDKKDLNYFEQEPRAYTYRGDKLPDGWEVDYYNMFVSNQRDDLILDDILYQIKQLEKHMDEVEYLSFVVRFVQGAIAYDWDSYYNVTDKLNYPIETLYKKKGVCSDKSLILGKLLAKLGYDVVFMTFKKANHMALGIRVPQGYGNLETDYAFIESTDYSPIGEIPENFVGGVKIEETPMVIPIENSGNKIFHKIADYQAEKQEIKEKFGDHYSNASAEEKTLLEEMKTLETEIAEIKDKIENFGCRGNVTSDKINYCNKFHKRVNEKIDLYNEKVKLYNEKNN